MQELVRIVVNRTGLSHERATVVVRITLDWIKQKLPAHLAAQIDILINGSDASEDPRIYLGNSVGKK
jgi:hypothetical protein